MRNPVDLTNLRSMTDGDAELEAALFEEFYASFEAGIAALQTLVEDIDSELWCKRAHALKGVALNLGAERLGELCNQAQEKSLTLQKGKMTLLHDIETEYRAVKQFLIENII